MISDNRKIAALERLLFLSSALRISQIRNGKRALRGIRCYLSSGETKRLIRVLMCIVLSLISGSHIALAQKAYPVVGIPSGTILYGSNAVITCTENFQQQYFESYLIIDGDYFPSGSYDTSTGVTSFGIGSTAVGGHSAECVVDNNIAITAVGSFEISKATPTINWAAPSPIIYGTALGPSQLGVTAISPYSGQSLPGSFSYSPGAGSILGVGAYTLSVNFTPSDTTDWNVASSSVSLQINKASPLVSVTCFPNPVAYDAGYSCIASTSLGALATGTITWTTNGAFSGTSTLSSGVTSLSGIASVAPGTITIGASYSGDANDNPGSATTALSVVAASQGINFAGPTSPVVYGVSPISLSASGGASGNPVVFSVLSGPGIISGNVLTVTGAGSIVIAANQAGNTDYAAAAQVTRTLVVNQIPQTIRFCTPPSSVTYGVPPIILSAIGGRSGNPVIFSVTSGPGSISGNSLSITGAGMVIVAANQAGNANYAAAPTISFSVNVNPISQAINFVMPTSPVSYGASPPISLSATGGASGNPVTFSILSGPGSISGTTLTVTGIGTIVVAANQAGTSNYATAPQVTRTIVANLGGDVIMNIAGNGISGFLGDSGPATIAKISLPTANIARLFFSGVALDSAGNIYIADGGNGRIREVTRSTGLITTIAGPGNGGLPGVNGDGGPALAAGLSCPNGLAIDASNNIYIADSCVENIREISASTGIISTVVNQGAGSTYAGANNLQGVAVDSSDNVYYTDAGSNTIHKVIPSGTDMIVAGSNGSPPGYTGDGGAATSATLNGLEGITVDTNGNIYFVDTYDGVVRKITAAGIISTVAGAGLGCEQQTDVAGDGCLATSAILTFPQGIAVDAAGNLYITEMNDIRLVTASGGVISTIAGNGAGCTQQSDGVGDGCLATMASLNDPTGITIDGSHNIYFADNGHSRVRAIGGTVNVSPDIVWNPPAAITYGISLSATQLNASSSVPGTFTYSPALGTVLTAGLQTLAVTFTPTDTTDYQISSRTVSLMVNKAIPLISWATPASVAYGTGLSAAQLDASSTVPGTLSYAPAAGTVLPSGPHTLQATLVPSDTLDYNTAVAEVPLIVSEESGTRSDSGTITLTVNGIVSATTTYGASSTPVSIAAGLASGVAPNSPIIITANDDALYLQSKTSGQSTDFAYTLQAVSNDPTDFPNPSFIGAPSSGTLDAGANPNASGTNLYSYSSTYDGVGNPISSADSVMGTWSPITYDSLNRLAGATVQPASGGSAYYCWGYDAFGNRTIQSISDQTFQVGSPSCTAPSGAIVSVMVANLSTLNNNQLSTTSLAPGGVTYDPAGEVLNDGVNQYLYDAEGRICAVANMPIMTGYIYGADGSRVAKGTISNWSCDPSTNGFKDTNDYVISNGEQVTELAANNANTMVWQHTNVFGPGGLLATYDTNGLHFHLKDQLGNRRTQTDYAGVLEQTCTNSPFGDNLACTGSIQFPTEQHFTGKERDAESGLDYFGARYFGSSIGRLPSSIKAFIAIRRWVAGITLSRRQVFGLSSVTLSIRYSRLRISLSTCAVPQAPERRRPYRRLIAACTLPDMRSWQSLRRGVLSRNFRRSALETR